MLKVYLPWGGRSGGGERIVKGGKNLTRLRALKWKEGSEKGKERVGKKSVALNLRRGIVRAERLRAAAWTLRSFYIKHAAVNGKGKKRVRGTGQRRTCFNHIVAGGPEVSVLLLGVTNFERVKARHGTGDYFFLVSWLLRCPKRGGGGKGEGGYRPRKGGLTLAQSDKKKWWHGTVRN